jgi:nanoRNase/pAp phosphatase (c-di-AMP/oligoRNAs hydrolase)
VDVNAVAKEFGGGGHKNASGCSAGGTREALTELFGRKLSAAIARAQHPRA